MWIPSQYRRIRPPTTPAKPGPLRYAGTAGPCACPGGLVEESRVIDLLAGNSLYRGALRDRFRTLSCGDIMVDRKKGSGGQGRVAAARGWVCASLLAWGASGLVSPAEAQNVPAGKTRLFLW